MQPYTRRSLASPGASILQSRRYSRQMGNGVGGDQGENGKRGVRTREREDLVPEGQTWRGERGYANSPLCNRGMG